MPPPSISAPARPDDAHKGTFGTVIVVGGSATMLGAPAIAARAALRAGAGLVKLACPPGVLTHALVVEPGATGVCLDGSLDENIQAVQRTDPKAQAVLAIGPGIGKGDDVVDLVMRLLDGERAVVLDADGLNALASTGQQLAERRDGNSPPLVLTPHPGEFRRLAEAIGLEADPVDPDARPRAARGLAEAHSAVVVLKGHRTVVAEAPADPRVNTRGSGGPGNTRGSGETYINDTGNAAMATAGSGDVLTGVIASLMAQGMHPFDAACTGVHAHGRAAERWSQSHGGATAGMLARELADAMVASIAEARG